MDGVPTGAVLADALAELERAAATLAAVDVHGLPPAQLGEALTTLETADRQLGATRSKLVSAVEADGRWAASGARTMASWYRMHTGRLDAESARTVRLARCLRDHLPRTAEALAAGRISIDHAQALLRHATGTPARLEQLRQTEAGEATLLELCEQQDLDAGQFTHLVKNWALRADPEAADRAWKDDGDREQVVLAKTMDGWHLRGWLDPAHGQLVKTALDARTGVPSADDPRSPAQRSAGALVGLASLVLDAGALQPSARVRPQLAVTVPFATLRLLGRAAGNAEGRCGTDVFGGVVETIETSLDHAVLRGAEPATLADGSPIPHGLLARLACSSQLHRVVFGPDSEILDSGREKRLFTAGQTRAIVARDGHCQYPRCNAPPGEGEIHHTVWWAAELGDTATRTGILQCWSHHDFVHRHNVRIERHPGEWRFLRADGTLLGTTPITDRNGASPIA